MVKCRKTFQGCSCPNEHEDQLITIAPSSEEGNISIVFAKLHRTSGESQRQSILLDEWKKKMEVERETKD